MHAIIIDKVTKTFNKFTAVDNLSLTVPRGSIYGFIGPNGSGKTTTIRMIMNIFYPDNGNIEILGEEHIGSSHDNIGYLPEERGLYKKMKVREILQFYGQLRKTSDLNNKIDYWLKKLEISEWADKKIEALSKGMSQKIQFITTIIHEPDIIILDEPFSGLDPVNSEVVKSAILSLKEKGKTVIFSTHDMSMAERMCDYIFMIYKGKKVLDGTLDEIQDKFGTDTIRINAEKASSVLKDITGIDKINDYGQYQEIKLTDGTDSQDVLKQIISKTRVNRFELTRPSLHDIFIRIAKPEAEDINPNQN
ncbi:MAG: ATP-binding cassette domain-containing protein [Bacteroidales bacterium]|nr:ATP-binding cassette domain-containing protein [Bacteroidales bacterium]MBN2820758.1 ATP-binding cassette domain-containing protein [Bacteroidales bacterium]